MLPPITLAGGRSTCMTAFAIVVLPQPDSPARPRISPAAIDRLTPSTGDDVAVGDPEIAHLDQRLARGVRNLRQITLGHCHFDLLIVRSRGLLTSSIPASRKTSPTTVMTRARPGKRNGHHSPCSTVELVCAQ